MWQLLPSRSRRRGRHRVPLRVVLMPITICRLRAAGRSSGSRDPLERQIPGFILWQRGLTTSVPACVLLLQLSLGRFPSDAETGLSPSSSTLTVRSEDPSSGSSLSLQTSSPAMTSPAPVSKTRQTAAKEEEEGGSPHKERLSLTSLVSRCNPR